MIDYDYCYHVNRKKDHVDHSGIRPHSKLPVLYASCRPLAAMIMNFYEL